MSVKVVREHWIAAAWGFAESTLFFIVPDVLLTRVALEQPKRAYTASAFALAGALLGGALMFAWATFDAQSARTAIDAIPGIRPDMIAKVSADLDAHGLLSLFVGPTRGVPYKIYAVEWAALDGGFSLFALISVPARLLRFLITAAIARLLRRSVFRNCSVHACQWAHAALWLAFYAWYFYVMSE